MRLTTVILVATFMQVSAAGFAQQITLNKKQIALEAVLKEIHNQSGYDFFFDRKLIEKLKPVSITVKNATLEETMKITLQGLPLTYNIEGKIVIIKKKEPSLLGRLSDYFDNISVSGKITDENGLPLAGAYIRALNTSGISYITGKEGTFYFKDIDEKERLVVSYIGYKTDTVAINSRTRVEIIMKALANTINEVEIVSTGYQNLPRERATGSFGVVTAKELNQYPVTSILERLQGLVPGVNISTKTTAGKSRNGTVNVRGISTIVSSYTKVSTDPLLVIDGFPSQQSITNGAFDFINPDDIEQVTFLKDAAAASIWGIQAANGVIVITTKKGSRNSKPVFNFSTTFGTSQQPKADYGKLMTMSSYIALEKELIDKGRLNDPVANTSNFFPENNSQAQAIVWAAKRGAITETQRDQQLATLALDNNSDQISDLMLQSPTTRQYNLSLSGGGPNSSTFVSGYFYDEDRAYKSNKNRGYSIKASNVSNILNGRVTLTSDLSVGNTKDKINGAAVTAMSIASGGMRPYDMLQDENGNNIYYDVLVNPVKATDLESKGYLSFKYSPVDELNYSNTMLNSSNININIAANGKITPWLSANVSGNLGRNFRERELYWEPDSYDARMMVNKGISLGTGNVRTFGIPQGGKLDMTNALGRTYSVRGQALVDKNWNGKHQLNAVIGNEIREQFTKESGEIRYGVDKTINAFRTVNPTVGYKDWWGQTQTIGATSRPVTEKTTRSLSYYSNASYTFENKYTVSGSARFDDYNLLGVDRRDRAKPLWSAGLKWNAKNEEFLKNVSWLSGLSARGTYGFSGNAPQGYAPVAVINLLGNEFYTGYPYGVIATPAVDNLGWETTRMINYGLDFSLFNNRVSGSFEYYQKKTTDIIWNLPINGAYGFTSTLFNTANLDGQGLDMSLTVVSVTNRDFRLSTTLNVSWNTNIIKDVRFETPTLSFSPENLYSGYPTDYLFSYIWAGLDKEGQSLIKDPKIEGKVYNVLEFPFQDIRTYSGRTTSPWYGSFSNNFQYKQWDLNVQLMYSLGGVFRKPSVVAIGFTNNTNVGRSGDLDERWMNPGDEATKNVPALYFGSTSNYNQSLSRYSESDYLIRSKSNVRLQQISLSYNLPKKTLDKLGIKGLSFSGVCRNLGMIWAANKEGLDPDYLYTTGNNYQLAPVPSFSFRTGLTF